MNILNWHINMPPPTNTLIDITECVVIKTNMYRFFFEVWSLYVHQIQKQGCPRSQMCLMNIEISPKSVPSLIECA